MHACKDFFAVSSLAAPFSSSLVYNWEALKGPSFFTFFHERDGNCRKFPFSPLTMTNNSNGIKTAKF